MEIIKVAQFAQDALVEWAITHGDYFKDGEELFNALDSMFYLIPEQDAQGDSFVWVCNYAGGIFYVADDIVQRSYSNYHQ